MTSTKRAPAARRSTIPFPRFRGLTLSQQQTNNAVILCLILAVIGTALWADGHTTVALVFLWATVALGLAATLKTLWPLIREMLSDQSSDKT